MVSPGHAHGSFGHAGVSGGFIPGDDAGSSLHYNDWSIEMEQRRINPWKWQDNLVVSQAVEVVGGQRVLYCSGQAAIDGDGQPAHPGDMRAQIMLALDNIETVLHKAGYQMSDVVQLNYYVTNVDAFFAAYDALAGRLAAAGIQPACTLLGVARLAFPQLLVELEATAVK
ncbi:MAG: Bona fide RidA/YjgF/TdcF/RutC subgroup [Massilia sp.]|jgi:enamine deaminase RidA (YjgF/YER057c/UK114 family)|nr:Bona fide RidA/YjgF/TdcF/RutC subgroup [Massilia sp.]